MSSVLAPPLDDAAVEPLKAGDRVVITGKIYTARDSAHKRMLEALANGEALPFDIKGQVIFYAGPSPAPPGKPIGSIGPTTSYRMDAYTPVLLELGLKATIGKGERSAEVISAMRKYKGIYLAAVGGVAALLAGCIKSARVIAYEDLGPEAIRELEVEKFPAIVVNDIYGNDLYEQGVKKYALPLKGF